MALPGKDAHKITSILYGLAVIIFAVIFHPLIFAILGGLYSAVQAADDVRPTAAVMATETGEPPDANSTPLAAPGELAPPPPTLGHEPATTTTTVQLFDPAADGNWHPTATTAPPGTVQVRPPHEAIECAHVLSPNCDRSR